MTHTQNFIICTYILKQKYVKNKQLNVLPQPAWKI